MSSAPTRVKTGYCHLVVRTLRNLAIGAELFHTSTGIAMPSS